MTQELFVGLSLICLIALGFLGLKINGQGLNVFEKTPNPLSVISVVILIFGFGLSLMFLTSLSVKIYNKLPSAFSNDLIEGNKK